MAGESGRARPPPSLAQLRRWQRGGRSARPGCGASSVPAATAATARPCPHPGARRGPWGAAVGSPRLSPSHRPGTEGGMRWQRGGNVPKIEACSALALPPPGRGDGDTGRATPARLQRPREVAPGGTRGWGTPRARRFPLIGAVNGGRFPLRGLAGGTSCATALIKLPVRGDGARWPHGTGTVPPPCHPPPDPARGI